MRKPSVILVALVMFALLASACGGGRDVSIDTNRRRPELLYLGSRTAITAISPRSGHVRFQEAGAVPSRDWSVLYSATNDGTSTTLRTLDPTTGAELASRTLPGVLAVRTVSEDGAAVALSPPPPPGSDTYHPAPKDPTPLVIVRRGTPEPQVLSVPGNVEPEAFSLEGDALFVIDFVPPLAPERYRVARLDLGSGRVGDVRSNEEELQEPMRGTARAQVMAPDGRRLYTLYTRDATATDPAEAFVHVLDLEEQRATCVDLPAEFAVSQLGALAVSPSGTHLYVAAPAVRRARRARHRHAEGDAHGNRPDRIDRGDGPRRRVGDDAVRRRRRSDHRAGARRSQDRGLVDRAGHGDRAEAVDRQQRAVRVARRPRPHARSAHHVDAARARRAAQRTRSTTWPPRCRRSPTTAT